MSLAARFSLKGRCALVTGSSRGIGAAIASALAGAGADVTIHFGDRPNGANETAAACAALGVRTAVIEGDLGVEGGAERVYSRAAAALGAPDIVVLNASIQIVKDWLEISREDVDRQIAVNYRASLELLQRAVPPMIERRWGRILTIGSVQQTKPHPEMLVYSSLKSAQAALALSLARQLAPHGITVNNLAPGAIDTERNHDRLSDPAYHTQVLGRIPAGRIGEPIDCAGAALLLCSDAGSYVTGQNLFLDGGMGL